MDAGRYKNAIQIHVGLSRHAGHRRKGEPKKGEKSFLLFFVAWMQDDTKLNTDSDRCITVQIRLHCNADTKGWELSAFPPLPLSPRCASSQIGFPPSLMILDD
jgi:hypothetical protein